VTGSVAPRFTVLGSTLIDVSWPPSDLGRGISRPPTDRRRVLSE